MSDYLINLGQNSFARKAIKTLGLPIPLPQKLKRQRGGEVEKVLTGLSFATGGKGAFAGSLHNAIVEAGGQISEQAPTAANKVNGLVFDATAIATYSDLRALYDFFQPAVRALKASGRIVVLGTAPASATSPEAAAVQQALVGFTKSLAKEIGKAGSTAQVLFCEPGAESRGTHTLTFLLSPKSAFVSGQVFTTTKQVKDAEPEQKGSPLSGKSAVVTGAARGIGKSIAQGLAAAGAHVYCVDLPSTEEQLASLASDISGTPLPLDITADNAAEQMLAAAGSIDVIVHNAGVTRDKTLKNMKPEHWDQVLEINLGAILKINQALLSGGLNENARIVVLSSVGGIAGNFGQTNYAATKAALIGYVDAMAPQLAGRGISINAVAPGFIETRMTQGMPVTVREVGRRFNALSQGGLPEDVAALITYLSTPGACGVTGQVIRVCGLNMLGA